MGPELAHYLNRNYWQQKSFEMKNTSMTQPSAPSVSSSLSSSGTVSTKNSPLPVKNEADEVRTRGLLVLVFRSLTFVDNSRNIEWLTNHQRIIWWSRTCSRWRMAAAPTRRENSSWRRSAAASRSSWTEWRATLREAGASLTIPQFRRSSWPWQPCIPLSWSTCNSRRKIEVGWNFLFVFWDSWGYCNPKSDAQGC